MLERLLNEEANTELRKKTTEKEDVNVNFSFGRRGMC